MRASSKGQRCMPGCLNRMAPRDLFCRRRKWPRLPVRLLWGENDTEVPVEVAERAMEILGERATLELVKGGGHLLPVTSPKRVRAEIEALL